MFEAFLDAHSRRAPTRRRRLIIAALMLAGLLGVGGLYPLVSVAPTAFVNDVAQRLAAHDYAQRAARRLGYERAGTAPTTYPLAIDTALYDVRVRAVDVGDNSGSAALALAGERLVVATRYGEIHVFDAASGDVTPLGPRVPMNLEAFQTTELFKRWENARLYFRVLDLLVVPQSNATFDLYVSHEYYVDECVEPRVSRLRLTERDGTLLAADDAFETIATAQPCLRAEWFPEGAWIPNSTGGRMVQLDDEHILWATGDHSYGGLKARGHLKGGEFDGNRELGVALRLNTRTGAVERFSAGLRNPQGLTVDRQGRVWATEHGPRGGDELNLLISGQDYGWPQVTLGTDYEDGGFGKTWPLNATQGRHDGFTTPIYAWVPSIGISNLVETHGDEFPLWDGDLLVSSLKTESLYRLRLEGERVVYVEPMRIGARLRDIALLPDGRIALLGTSGRLLLIENANKAPPAGFFGGDLATRNVVLASAPDGAEVFAAQCASCHAVTPRNGIGPHLAGLFERPIGGADGFDYTAAFAGHEESWTPDRLAGYLADPQAVMRGTTMAAQSLSPAEQEALVKHLATQTQ